MGIWPKCGLHRTWCERLDEHTAQIGRRHCPLPAALCLLLLLLQAPACFCSLSVRRLCVQLTAQEIRKADLDVSVKEIQSGKQGPLALRLCGQLLLGLARIYGLKVEQTDDIATHVQNLLLKQGTSQERVAIKKRKVRHAEGDEDEEEEKQPLEARPESLRGKHHAITAVPAVSDGRFDEDYLNDPLGLDLDKMMDEGMKGGMLDEELREAMQQGFGPPDAVIDAAMLKEMNDGSGRWELTQNKSSSASVDDNRSVVDPDDIDGRLSPAPTDVDELDLEKELNKSVAGGRDAEAGSDNGLGLDTSALSNVNKSHMGGLGLEHGLDFGGSGEGFGELPPEDEIPASPAARRSGAGAGMADDDLAAEVQAASADLLTKEMALAASLKKQKQSLKDRASRKRAKGAYVPQVDDITELPSAVIKHGLENTADILHAHAGRPSLLTQRLTVLQRRTQEAQAFMQTREHVQPWCAPMSLAGSALGPALAASMRASYTTAPRLPGLPYRLQAEAPVAPAVPGTPLSHGDLAAIGGEDIDWGGDAGGDAFGVDGTEFPQQDQQEPEPVEPEQIDEAKDQEYLDQSFAENASILPDSSEKDGLARQDWLRFLGAENELTSAEQRSQIGWSQRAKEFHKKLKSEFGTGRGQGKDVELLGLLKQPSGETPYLKATAAACLYQTLVLASRGFVGVEQKQDAPFRPIHITKSNTFPKQQLPKTSQPTDSAMDNNSSSSNADDTEMSPAF